MDNIARGLGLNAARRAAFARRRAIHVGTRCGIFGETQSDASNLQMNCKTVHNIPVACTGLQFVWGNFWVNAGSTPTERAGISNIDKLTAGIGFASPSILTQRIFFGGKTEVAIPPDAFAVSDPQGWHIPAGSLGVLYSHVESGAQFYRGRAVVSAVGERAEEGVTVTDKSLGITIATTTAISYVPQAIVGIPDNPYARSVALIGDSITRGGSGSETADPTTAVIGYPEKGLGVSVPNMKLARSGDMLAAWVSMANWRRYSRMALVFQYCTDAFINLGANDLYVNHRTLSQLQADIAILANECIAAGITVTIPTLTPITTGAWAQADGSDQTVTADEATRLGYNAWLLAGGLPGVRILDIAALVAIPGNLSKWRAGYTGDGLHPNNTGAAAAAVGHPPSSSPDTLPP